MIDRTLLGYWRTSIAARLVDPQRTDEPIDVAIARERDARVRTRLMALKGRMRAGERRLEGVVCHLPRRSRNG